MNIFEVVSLTQHTDRIDNAIETAIINALRLLAAEQDQHAAAEKHADLRNDLEPLIAELEPIFHKDLRDAFQRQLNSVIKNFMKTSGKATFTGIWFKPMKERAHADRRYVYLNEKYVTNIAGKIIDYVHELVLDNAYSDFAEAFYQQINTLAKAGSKQTALLNHVRSTMNDMSSIIVHELVHTKQHTAQLAVGKDDFEYRSYLDKYKGHLNDLNNQDADGPEFDYLYYSSPQEIAAFAHTIAVNIIHKLGLNKITNVNQIEPLSGEKIVAHVNDFLNNSYKLPSKPQEYQVYKRYLKLVYVELTNYLNHVKQKLSSHL